MLNPYDTQTVKMSCCILWPIIIQAISLVPVKQQQLTCSELFVYWLNILDIMLICKLQSCWFRNKIASVHVYAKTRK